MSSAASTLISHVPVPTLSHTCHSTLLRLFGVASLLPIACFQTKEAPESAASTSTKGRSATAQVTYRAAASEVAGRNRLQFGSDPACRVRIGGAQASFAEVRTTVKQHVLNEGYDPRYAESAAEAVVVIAPAPSDANCEQALSEVVGEVQIAYRETWDQEARERGFAGYEDYVDQLEPDAPNDVRQAISDQIYVLSRRPPTEARRSSVRQLGKGRRGRE
jgi:hypothetical protein